MDLVTETRGVQYSAQAAGAVGNIRCHVIRHQPAHERRARYSIVACNESAADVQALAFVPDGPDGRPRTIVQTIIAPGSDFSTAVVLPLTPAGMMPELRVALSSGETRFTLEVPAVAAEIALADEISCAAPAMTSPQPLVRLGAAALPRAYAPPVPPYASAAQRATGQRQVTLRPARARSSPAVLPMLLLFAGVLAAAGALLGRPRIDALEMPVSAAPGAPVAVSYRATGLGSAAFSVVGPDGRTVRRGGLALGNGSFAFPLPTASGAPAYMVRLSMTNPLAAAAAEAYVRVESAAAAPQPKPRLPAAAPAPAAPQIRSLALDRATLAGGESLNVYYNVAASGGTIALLDPASQITYGKADLSPAGHVAFTAPHVDAPRQLTVVLTAQRGKTTTQSRIAVTVTPPNADGPAAALPAAGDSSAELPATETGSVSAGLVLWAPVSVLAGNPVHVGIRGVAGGAHVVMLDGTGNEVAARDVPAGGRNAVFTAPAVRTATRFVLEATSAHGAGSETVVRAITVTP